ncbi:MAG: DAK2 domain-containing protein [Bacilli bacterium]|jgi:DAK2 domain fusion protein YloV|nr:DAK2 domain-containing protein [Bacilli bacterium]
MIKIDGVILKQMIISASNNLYNSYPEIDALNVFPVPDGDTGTNMNLTLSSGAKEVFNKNEESISQVAKDFARGLLMGARGNSGVILSQIFRGFAEGLNGKNDVDAIGLADAFVAGKEVAYKAVMRPVEGTILTVIRESSAALYEKAEKDMPMDQALDILSEEAQKSLQRTPDLLPVLKEVGVVDSGGAGLCKIFEGFSKALHNQIVEKTMPTVTESQEPYSTGKPQQTFEPGRVQAKFEHKEFGYCTQFLLDIGEQEKASESKKLFNEKRFKAMLEAHGNSIVYARVENLVKVHVHTLKPGNILTYAQQFGEFKLIKVDNMSEQHEEIMLEDKEMKQAAGVEEDTTSSKIEVTTSAAPTTPVAQEPAEKPAEEKMYALIAVAVGDGVEKLFKELNVDYLVTGGQTMNPSTEDFVKAIHAVHAKNVFILPNNGNIFMAAKQAGDIVENETHVEVIPTKTIPEGLVACSVFNVEGTVEDNLQSMKENIDGIQSGEVTYAIKDTTIDGITVGKNKFMGISQKKILCCHKHKTHTLYDLLKQMVTEDSQIITVIYGKDVTKEEQDEITKTLNNTYGKSMDVSIEYGGQPVYSFFVSVE